MFTKIILENIGIISQQITLDFTINKRDKDMMSTISILDDGTYITKRAGIIAGNACGKTTILNSLTMLGAFMEMPLNKSSLPKISDLNLDEYKDEYRQKIFDKFINRFDDYSLILPNLKNENSVASIYVEMYIKTQEEKTSGFYGYTIKYDKNYKQKGLIEESLKFRKKYSSKNNTELFKLSGHYESEIGYKLAYEQNILKDIENNKKLYKEINERLLFYKAFINQYINQSSTIGAENYVFPEFWLIDKIKDNLDLVESFIKLADDNIKSITIEDDDTDKPKLYFKYDYYKLRYANISTATKKLCAIASSFIKSNKPGGVFLIDELDNSLNRVIINSLIEIYDNNVVNNNAQVIFTTNTPEILNNLRRDQIFIITKKVDTIILTKYSDYIDSNTNKRVRKDFSFSKAYRNNIIKNFPSDNSIKEFKEKINNSFISM